MNELANTPHIAGLPTTEANPSYSKDIFKKFVPKFADFIDRENGVIETIKNLATVGTVITDVATKIDFTNEYIADDGDKTVLALDSSDDVIIGKSTTLCYREAYNSKSEVIITDTSGLANQIFISYLLDDELFKSEILTLTALQVLDVIIDFDFANSTAGSILTIQINDANNAAVITFFRETVISNFKAARGDGSALYEAFCGIADNKIIQSIWNSDWELGMSYCIAHYLAITNTESEVSYGLGDIAKDSGPRGIVVSDIDKIKYDYKHIMLSNNETKFWNGTQFGRVLIALLYTKAVPTIIVVN